MSTKIIFWFFDLIGERFQEKFDEGHGNIGFGRRGWKLPFNKYYWLD